MTFFAQLHSPSKAYGLFQAHCGGGGGGNGFSGFGGGYGGWGGYGISGNGVFDKGGKNGNFFKIFFTSSYFRIGFGQLNMLKISNENFL